ncbi:fibromodulin-like [Megalops cyprinoides]|uniref:fibromodulin-like n=1 Tax=Megalops cyprinoides TaxID=118141 RepID=UPI00186565B5|nr:fibromodulin-like [Megalops cyprinoides]
MTFRLCALLLVAGLCDLAVCHRQDPFLWLSYLRSRWRTHGAMLADTSGGDCPLECECPPSYPVAMYCNGRNLQNVPYVPSRMKYVYLQNNLITGIRDGAFDNATNLVWLMLHDNLISSEALGDNVFAKLSGLERLYLDHNRLNWVPPNLPRTIRELRLNHNNISEISASAFEGMDDLTILQLHNNAIQDLGGALKSLPSLTQLDISSNSLRKVPALLPERLHQLYMESNSIDTVPADFLTKLSQLQFVRLAHNQLTDRGIPPNAFNVSGLVELDLSFNKLERIPPVNRRLQNLYLQANQIKEFSLGSLCSVVDSRNYSHLKVLRLDGNEINTVDWTPEFALCLRLARVIDL